MISAIILTWNSAKFIEKCLQSLIADGHHANLKIEIFVVDGGSTDGTLEILDQLAKNIPELKVIELGKNLGTTVSRNAAIRESKGEYILILDSDTEILPGTLETLHQVLSNSPRVGIAAPRLLYSNGTIQPSCKHFPTIFLKAFKFVPLRMLQRLGERMELYPREIYDRNFKDILRVEYCISACWLVRRQAMNAIGLLDEKFFYAPEDVDYCLRMWLGGWEVLCVTTAEVLHYTQRRSYKSAQIAWIHAQGLIYYFWKYRYAFSRRRIYKRIRKVAKQFGLSPPFGI